MSPQDVEQTSSNSPPDPDYGDLCDLAVQLTLALQDTDVFKLASNHLISTIPAVTSVRFVHNGRDLTEMMTVRPGRTMGMQCCLSRPLRAGEPFWPVPSRYSDRQAWKQEFGAASMYTAPMHSKGMALGTLTVGSGSPDAFAGRWAETVDIVGAMVAPYLQISECRLQLEVKQKCLVDSLPAKVASHMLERRSMGMTPVMQSAESCWDHGQASISSSEDNETSTI